MPRHNRSIGLEILDRDFKSDRVAWSDFEWNLALLDFGQYSPLAKTALFTDQESARLGEPFDEQRGGVDREAWNVFVQCLFGQRDRFHRQWRAGRSRIR